MSRSFSSRLFRLTFLHVSYFHQLKLLHVGYMACLGFSSPQQQHLSLIATAAAAAAAEILPHASCCPRFLLWWWRWTSRCITTGSFLCLLSLHSHHGPSHLLPCRRRHVLLLGQSANLIPIGIVRQIELGKPQHPHHTRGSYRNDLSTVCSRHIPVFCFWRCC